MRGLISEKQTKRNFKKLNKKIFNRFTNLLLHPTEVNQSEDNPHSFHSAEDVCVYEVPTSQHLTDLIFVCIPVIYEQLDCRQVDEEGYEGLVHFEIG